MITLNQLVRKPRIKVKFKRQTLFLGKGPQRKGICVRVYTTKPKKPHSAIRKIAKLHIPYLKRYVLAAIPGQGHNLSVHSVVMIRGGRVRDIPGIHAKMIRKKYDFIGAEVVNRSRRRSKYGLSRNKL